MSQVKFFNSKRFLVVGASKDQTKFGNKCLRWYLNHHLNAIPVNHKEEVIENVKTISSIKDLNDYESISTSISIITPPSVTAKILDIVIDMKYIKNVWIQPDAEPTDQRLLQKVKDCGVNLLYGGPCILVSGEESLNQSKI